MSKVYRRTDGNLDRLTGQIGPEKRRCAKNVNDHVLVRYLFEVGFLIVYILILFFHCVSMVYIYRSVSCSGYGHVIIWPHVKPNKSEFF